MGWVLTHPWCRPPWPGPLPEACWSPVACGAKKSGFCGADTSYRETHTTPASPSSNPRTNDKIMVSP